MSMNDISVSALKLYFTREEDRGIKGKSLDYYSKKDVYADILGESKPCSASLLTRSSLSSVSFASLRMPS